jgi:hypothetical protein
MVHNLTYKQKFEYEKLTPKERKIYDSIMLNFPATSHDSALNKAWESGVQFHHCK